MPRILLSATFNKRYAFAVNVPNHGMVAFDGPIPVGYNEIGYGAEEWLRQHGSEIVTSVPVNGTDFKAKVTNPTEFDVDDNTLAMFLLRWKE